MLGIENKITGTRFLAEESDDGADGLGSAPRPAQNSFYLPEDKTVRIENLNEHLRKQLQALNLACLDGIDLRNTELIFEFPQEIQNQEYRGLLDSDILGPLRKAVSALGHDEERDIDWTVSTLFLTDGSNRFPLISNVHRSNHHDSPLVHRENFTIVITARSQLLKARMIMQECEKDAYKALGSMTPRLIDTDTLPGKAIYRYPQALLTGMHKDLIRYLRDRTAPKLSDTDLEQVELSLIEATVPFEEISPLLPRLMGGLLQRAHGVSSDTPTLKVSMTIGSLDSSEHILSVAALANSSRADRSRFFDHISSAGMERPQFEGIYSAARELFNRRIPMCSHDIE